MRPDWHLNLANVCATGYPCRPVGYGLAISLSHIMTPGGAQKYHSEYLIEDPQVALWIRMWGLLLQPVYVHELAFGVSLYILP